MEAGYLGVGNMGQPMAHKLLNAGHGLTIYDINETAMQPLLERQARRATSPKDLADRCEIVFDYWFAETEGEDARRFIAASLEASDDVQQEDVAICESVQRGVSSRSYDTGRYARSETGMYHFHRLLAQELREES